MDKLMRIYAGIRAGKRLDEQDLSASIVSTELSSLQAGSLLSGLRRRVEMSRVREALQKRFPELREIDDTLRGSNGTRPYVSGLLDDIANRRVVGASTWDLFARDVVEGRVPPHLVAFVLMEITLCGLTGESTYRLADAMRRSGRIYDYRQSISPRMLLRRYPTGALSEKVALILPSLLACAAKTYAVASNFLVAKSLGFTGGTWDKLSSVPGFLFPKPGGETEQLLKAHSVAMCVTHEDLAPCDRILYQMRSMCGTIESRALIVSSIASKQGALPADLLLLDVRYGDGAFMGPFAEAAATADEIVTIMGRWGLRCTPSYLSTNEPNGVAIGNALEVCEAIAVMGRRVPGPWDQTLIEAQWDITRGFFVTLLRNAFPEQTEAALLKFADASRSSGRLLAAFNALLRAHGVHTRIADALCNDPIAFYFRHPPSAVSSLLDGTITKLDQKQLGYLVNFLLGGGGNDFGGRKDLRAGCILRIRTGQRICKGDPLALVYSSDATAASWSEAHERIHACVTISPTKRKP